MKVRRGFTLIEVMLYIALTLTILMVVVSFFLAAIEAQGRQKKVLETDTEAAFLIKTIQTYLDQATAVTNPAAGSSDTTLTFTMPEPAQSPITIAANDDDGNVYITIGGAAPRLLAGNDIFIYNLLFSNRADSGEKASIHMEMNATSPSFFNQSPLRYEQIYHASLTKR